MFSNVKKKKILEIASKFATTDKLLETTLCYVRQRGEIGEITYLATRNPDIISGVVEEIERIGIDLGLDLKWALNAYEEYVANSDGLEEYVIRLQNDEDSIYISVNELDLKSLGVQIIPVSEMVERFLKLNDKLKSNEVLVTYIENGSYRVLRTSLSNKALFHWVYNGSGREVYQIQQYFEQGYDIGKVTLPDLDVHYPSYRYISLLDVVKVEVVE